MVVRRVPGDGIILEMALPERVRRQLMAETGMDFGRLGPAARRVVSEDRAGGGLIAAVAWGLLTGLATALVLVLITAVLGVTGLAAIVGLVGAVVAGVGVAAAMSGLLVRRRLPDEVDEVFRVAGRVASDASEQLEQVAGSAEQLVRGVVVVSAIPAVTAVVSKRFLVLAPMVRVLVEGLLSRLVDRGLPSVMATMPDATPRIREIATGVAASRDRVIGRVGTLGRWATAPFRVGGTALFLAGSSLAVLAWLVGAP